MHSFIFYIYILLLLGENFQRKKSFRDLATDFLSVSCLVPRREVGGVFLSFFFLGHNLEKFVLAESVACNMCGCVPALFAAVPSLIGERDSGGACVSVVLL